MSSAPTALRLPLELAIHTGEKRYLALGLRIAREQWAAPTPEQLAKLKPEPRAIAEQAVKEGLTWHTRYWIDDMFMITLLQAQAYRATGDARFIDRTAKEMVYLHDAPRHVGAIKHKTSANETIIPLMQLLREEVCVRRGKEVIFRTWLSFDTKLETYEAVSVAVEPHANLIISVKHCEGDFHQANPFSKVIGASVT